MARDDVCPAAGTLPDGDGGFHRLLAQRLPRRTQQSQVIHQAGARLLDLAELTDDAQVIVSELLANAIRHAGPGQPGRDPRAGATAPGLWLLRQAHGLMCVVTDPSDLVPALRQPGDTGECGRGLHVVHALSDHWGWTLLRDHGKAVWAILFCG